jgi:peptidoglycan/xylan/chitin deacetylase (PgdA/CDA1 family)
MNSPVLHIVTYHYVRDLPRTRFPRIKGMLTSDFRRQVAELSDCFEMATLESALAFLKGEYRPAADLCLLTFDDGLKEHFTEATPVLAERGIQGVFHVITGCLEERQVAPVHMNHFLMATLPFDEYRDGLLKEIGGNLDALDDVVVQRTYPWDVPEVAAFKYLFNFVLQPSERDAAVGSLFHRYLGDEETFSRELYLSWEEAREMQSAGMSLGGHTHAHRPVSKLSESDMLEDLTACRRLLDANLSTASLWPFCFPYGKRDSFNRESVEVLRQLGFDCAFTTESEVNRPGVDLFGVNRVDCKNAPRGRSGKVSAA